MKNVLLIHRSLGIGGAEKIFAFLANSLVADYQVEVLLLSKGNATMDLDERIGVVQNDCYSNSPIVGRNMKSGLLGLRDMAICIKDEANKFHADLVICFDLRILLATSLIKNKLSASVLFSERADPYANPKYWAFLLKRIYKRIDFIVFQTDAAAGFYGDLIKGKSCVIPNPAFPRIGTVDRTNIETREPYIFAAGRFQRRKGFDLLIDAFCRMKDTIPNYKLVLFGEGEEEEKLIQLIKNNNANDCIEIRKPINGVIERNRCASLFVIPSRSEGIPNILIEAMYEGIPCVATDCSPGGARLLSGNGQYCLLAENDNSDSLAEKMKYAFVHYQEMLDNTINAKKSLSRFDQENVKNMWLEVVRKII